MANSDTSQLDVRIAIGVGLLPHVPELIEQVGELRALLHADQFIEMPRVRMTDDLQLPPREYVIVYNGVTMPGEGRETLLESLEYLMRIFFE